MSRLMLVLASLPFILAVWKSPISLLRNRIRHTYNNTNSGVTYRISIGTGCIQGNKDAYGGGRISADGRYIAFASESNNLVSNDNNNKSDIFVYDRITVETTRISVSSDDTGGNGQSIDPRISADGRYISYRSSATNLIPLDLNGAERDVFVFDRLMEETILISKATDGRQGNYDSDHSEISGNGRYIAFTSIADNLVSGVSGNRYIYLHDRDTDEDGIFDEEGYYSTILISKTSSGIPADSASDLGGISSDGRLIVFYTNAGNLLPGSDTNGNHRDVFLHDRDVDNDGIYDEPGQFSTTLISKSPDTGEQGNGLSEGSKISADGKYIVFSSTSTNFLDEVPHMCGWPTLRPCRDVYVYSIQYNEMYRASIASNGTLPNDDSGGGPISANGQYILFSSKATNLVGLDTNFKSDVFIHNKDSENTDLVSISSSGLLGNNDSYALGISWTGKYILFGSLSNNLICNDKNDKYDIFIHDMEGGEEDCSCDDQGPSIGQPVFNSQVISNEELILTVDISDAINGNHGVDSAKILYGYSPPYTQNIITGESPAMDGKLPDSSGDGIWKFVFPPQGGEWEGNILHFYIEAIDGDLLKNISINNNNGNFFSVEILHSIYVPLVILGP